MGEKKLTKSLLRSVLRQTLPNAQFSWRCREETWVSIGIVAFASSSRCLKDSLWLVVIIRHTVQKYFFIFIFLNAPSQFMDVCRCSCSLPRWRNSHMAAQCAAFFFFFFYLRLIRTIWSVLWLHICTSPFPVWCNTSPWWHREQFDYLTTSVGAARGSQATQMVHSLLLGRQ